MSNFLSALQWRYAAKNFDPNKKISSKDLDTLLEAIRLSPSSYGLQPWKFLVISNPEVREQLKGAAFGQAQVTEASHLLVFCVKTDLGQKEIEAYINDMAQTRGMPAENLNGFKQMLEGFASSLPNAEAKINWGKKQAYIALGFGLFAAAEMQIDSCPMEGFDPQAFDQILGLAEKGLTTAVICPIGYRSSEDQTASWAKVRFPKEELFEFID